MSEAIRLVQGDTLPVITLTLLDKNTGDPVDPESWEAIDLSDPTTSVVVKFRKAGTTTVLNTISTTKISGGTGGQVFFSFPVGALAEAGLFEGEVEIDYNGSSQTVYDVLKFRVREQF